MNKAHHGARVGDGLMKLNGAGLGITSVHIHRPETDGN